MRRLTALIGILPIRVYQWFISPLLPGSCRYQPSCSAYAIEAIERHGVLRGFSLTLRRLLRCHPWGGFGYDPVPDPHRDCAQHHHISAATGSPAGSH